MKRNQRTTILNLLQNGETITSYESFLRFGVTRLSSVIHDLRKKGHKIIGTDERTINQFGEQKIYTRYSLEKSEV